MLLSDSFDLWMPAALRASGLRYWRGQIVRHERRGYRAVIVEWDPRCTRDAAWRECRPQRPSAEQPWYTLLIDGASTSSYVAQEELLLESRPAPIRHPLLFLFFQRFGEGQHWRNDRPWPMRVATVEHART